MYSLVDGLIEIEFMNHNFISFKCTSLFLI